MFELVVDTEFTENDPPVIVQVEIRSHELDENGLVCDFHDIRATVRKLSQRFDPAQPEFAASIKEHLDALYASEKFWPHSVSVRFPEKE